MNNRFRAQPCVEIQTLLVIMSIPITPEHIALFLYDCFMKYKSLDVVSHSFGVGKMLLTT